MKHGSEELDPQTAGKAGRKIRQWQPWDKSTGARTAEGKAASSRNAFKDSLKLHIRAMARSMNAMLREPREGLGRV
ncbi:hypothetical protein NTGZN8_100117 [Candidatus Nitrotoga fabula]|uniref:Uncharacterized protein n=1 Tax=Candidatus Nitrotoga fabula TaxID=2182327 RepID=A0A916BAR3_9PROT|nr:hypothetical protein NTGZN8_100117 [Candidatus Nitrotoga fabula]